MIGFFYKNLQKFAVYFRKTCHVWYYWLAGVLFLLATYKTSYILCNMPSKIDLILNLFTSILTIIISVFAGHSFIYLFRHTYPFFKQQEERVDSVIYELVNEDIDYNSRISNNNHIEILEFYKSELIEDRRSNIGIALLAYSTLFWQIGATLYLFTLDITNAQGSSPASPHYLKVLALELISTLNSGCLLGILASLRLAAETKMPKYWDLPYIKAFRKYRYIFFITICISALHIVLYFVFPKENYKHNILIQLPDFFFSIITIVLLHTQLKKLFIERGLKSFNHILTLVFLVVLIAQMRGFDPNDDYISFFMWKVIVLSYMVLLLMILFALSYSWRHQIARRTDKILERTISIISEHTKERADKIYEAKRQMNHIVRGSLKHLAKTVHETSKENKDTANLVERIQQRIWHFYDIHDILHKSEEAPRKVKIGEFMNDVLSRFGESHDFGESIQIIFEGRDFFVLFDYARDITLAISELISNSITALLDTAREERLIRVQSTVQKTVLIILVSDNGPGYTESSIKEGYGSAFIKRTIERDVGGALRKQEVLEGTEFRISIPISKIKIDYENPNS